MSNQTAMSVSTPVFAAPAAAAAFIVVDDDGDCTADDDAIAQEVAAAAVEMNHTVDTPPTHTPVPVHLRGRAELESSALLLQQIGQKICDNLYGDSSKPDPSAPPSWDSVLGLEKIKRPSHHFWLQIIENDHSVMATMAMVRYNRALLYVSRTCNNWAERACGDSEVNEDLQKLYNFQRRGYALIRSETIEFLAFLRRLAGRVRDGPLVYLHEMTCPSLVLFDSPVVQTRPSWCLLCSSVQIGVVPLPKPEPHSQRPMFMPLSELALLPDFNTAQLPIQTTAASSSSSSSAAPPPLVSERRFAAPDLLPHERLYTRFFICAKYLQPEHLQYYYKVDLDLLQIRLKTAFWTSSVALQFGRAVVDPSVAVVCSYLTDDPDGIRARIRFLWNDLNLRDEMVQLQILSHTHKTAYESIMSIIDSAIDRGLKMGDSTARGIHTVERYLAQSFKQRAAMAPSSSMTMVVDDGDRLSRDPPPQTVADMVEAEEKKSGPDFNRVTAFVEAMTRDDGDDDRDAGAQAAVPKSHPRRTRGVVQVHASDMIRDPAKRHTMYTNMNRLHNYEKMAAYAQEPKPTVDIKVNKTDAAFLNSSLMVSLGAKVDAVSQKKNWNLQSEWVVLRFKTEREKCASLTDLMVRRMASQTKCPYVAHLFAFDKHDHTTFATTVLLVFDTLLSIYLHNVLDSEDHNRDGNTPGNTLSKHVFPGSAVFGNSDRMLTEFYYPAWIYALFSTSKRIAVPIDHFIGLYEESHAGITRRHREYKDIVQKLTLMSCHYFLYDPTDETVRISDEYHAHWMESRALMFPLTPKPTPRTGDDRARTNWTIGTVNYAMLAVQLRLSQTEITLRDQADKAVRTLRDLHSSPTTESVLASLTRAGAVPNANSPTGRALDSITALQHFMQSKYVWEHRYLQWLLQNAVLAIMDSTRPEVTSTDLHARVLVTLVGLRELFDLDALFLTPLYTFKINSKWAVVLEESDDLSGSLTGGTFNKFLTNLLGSSLNDSDWPSRYSLKSGITPIKVARTALVRDVRYVIRMTRALFQMLPIGFMSFAPYADARLEKMSRKYWTDVSTKCASGDDGAVVDGMALIDYAKAVSGIVERPATVVHGVTAPEKRILQFDRLLVLGLCRRLVSALWGQLLRPSQLQYSSLLTDLTFDGLVTVPACLTLYLPRDRSEYFIGHRSSAWFPISDGPSSNGRTDSLRLQMLDWYRQNPIDKSVAVRPSRVTMVEKRRAKRNEKEDDRNEQRARKRQRLEIQNSIALLIQQAMDDNAFEVISPKESKQKCEQCARYGSCLLHLPDVSHIDRSECKVCNMIGAMCAAHILSADYTSPEGCIICKMLRHNCPAHPTLTPSAADECTREVLALTNFPKALLALVFLYSEHLQPNSRSLFRTEFEEL